MTASIRSWLESLGLALYAETFEENDLDVELAADLTDADLKDLGVASMGHRKKLLRAIEALAAHGEGELVTVTEDDEQVRVWIDASAEAD